MTKAREHVQHDMIAEDESAEDETRAHFVETPEYTFILPDLTQYPDDFRAFLHKELIETSTLVSLEQAGEKMKFLVWIWLKIREATVDLENFTEE